MANKKNRLTHNGFTIIELLIGALLTSIIALAVFQAYNHQQRVYVDKEDVTRVQQNMRTAMNVLEKNIKHAGFTTGDQALYLTYTPIEIFNNVSNTISWQSLTIVTDAKPGTDAVMIRAMTPDASLWTLAKTPSPSASTHRAILPSCDGFANCDVITIFQAATSWTLQITNTPNYHNSGGGVCTNWDDVDIGCCQFNHSPGQSPINSPHALSDLDPTLPAYGTVGAGFKYFYVNTSNELRLYDSAVTTEGCGFEGVLPSVLLAEDIEDLQFVYRTWSAGTYAWSNAPADPLQIQAVEINLLGRGPSKRTALGVADPAAMINGGPTPYRSGTLPDSTISAPTDSTSYFRRYLRNVVTARNICTRTSGMPCF